MKKGQYFNLKNNLQIVFDVFFFLFENLIVC